MRFKPLLTSILSLVIFMHSFSQEASIKPVTQNASEEAQALLEFIYSISDKQTLSGQHCAPLVGSTRLSVVHRRTGHYPALFGQDFGFSYPGDAYVDILATDVYTEGFNRVNYDQLLDLAGEKPIALGEVGATPSPEKLKEQPKWTWFMSWGESGGPGGNFRSFLDLYNSDQVLTHKELPWVKVQEPYLHHPVLK
ncbi:MAG: hypothetical protein KAT31_12310 [Bacteroidales bacterium]|nr:hypothetical protein [Bacteroidales bacterium]